MLLPVILAGGVGSRLWPLSRDLYPKQLLSLIGEQSLLQATVARVLQIPGVRHIMIVCNQQYQFLVEEQLDALKMLYPVTFDLILEPIGRNTAPALALAALRAKEFDNPFLLALPADHLIGNSAIFADQIQQVMLAAEDNLVTFGVKPTYPETGYGYIEVGDLPLANGILPIKRFVEKPNKAKAAEYCQLTNYYWNSGIFLYRAAVYLAELAAYAPKVLEVCELAWSQRTCQSESIYVDKTIYSQCADISIDYAVMEKTQATVMVPLSTTWDDVGSWLAVANIESANSQGNVSLGDVVAVDSYDCYLRSESRLLAVVGLKNQIVVETADAVLVADKSSAQDVKLLVEQLKNRQRKEAESHSVLYHPWGHYEVLCQGHGFIVKQITIKSQGLYSSCTEANNCEHWVVLSGAAHVQVAGLSSILSCNQFVDILPATHYSMQNESMGPLKMLNIQTTALSN